MLRNGDDLGSSHPRKLRAVHIANKGNEGGTIKAAIDGEEPLSLCFRKRGKKRPVRLSLSYTPNHSTQPLSRINILHARTLPARLWACACTPAVLSYIKYILKRTYEKMIVCVEHTTPMRLLQPVLTLAYNHTHRNETGN